ncbi:PAS domain S-box protein [Clostridium bovifaecis]|uniref:HTH-type transcriptional regulatory protein TyrR n=1 Tax=Clostridium bovifaecis TaxID=2184719 RepID=A0A6I6EZ75_9CLOT|nr:PAS domain S-box protein [Clostridium bovifaecis]
MISTRKVKIHHEKGLHARMAAMVVNKANELEKKYEVELYISYKDKKKVPATSLMPLVLLKIRRLEEITVEAIGNSTEAPLDEMIEFLKSDFNKQDKNTIEQVDNIINNNTITLEQVFENTANGIMAIDENDIVTIFNPSAEKILRIQAADVIGKKVTSILPSSRLDIVKSTGKEEIAYKQVVGDRILLTNRSPILIEGKSKGAVAIFEDISNIERIKGELKEVKELKERLQLILESVQDGICVLDDKGIVDYVNKAYLRIIGESKENILGKNIREISPEGARSKVLKEGRNIVGAISRKTNGATVVSNVNPIIIDGETAGVVSVVKNVTEIQELSEKLNKMSEKAEYLEQELIRSRKPHSAFAKFIGQSGKILDALAMALKAAKGNATVLIRGESGTGKELIAEGIHYSSTNAGGPFIRVNCAAIPSSLLESELFGHEKGAFTGAIKRKLGKFELANNGTIFLDEIGEMEKSMQAKVLRVIQEKEFERIGGEETIKIETRIIAATNRNLEEMVAVGEFREDLYYRLNVIPIMIPPLRERKQDLALLLEYFIEKLSKDLGIGIKGVSNEAMEALLEYKWPGNVRELENLVERIMTLADGEQIQLSDLPVYIRSGFGDLRNKRERQIRVDNVKNFVLENEEILPLRDYEKIIIEKALKKYRSFNAAGKALGITHKTVASKARLYGIEKIEVWEK